MSVVVNTAVILQQQTSVTFSPGCVQLTTPLLVIIIINISCTAVLVIRTVCYRVNLFLVYFRWSTEWPVIIEEQIFRD